jgi:hypothetical protein
VSEEPERGTLRADDGVEGRGYVIVPRAELGKLSPNALALHVALLSHAWQSEMCYPGQATLMRETQLGEHPLRKAKAELVAAGLLSEKRRGLGRPNLYTVRTWDRRLAPGNDDSSSLETTEHTPPVASTSSSPVASTGSPEVEPEGVETGRVEVEEDARASALFPDDRRAPEWMADEAAALAILVDVPREQGSKRPTLEAVETVHDQYPHLKMEALARELDFYARHGNGARRKVKSVMGTFRTFARKAEGDRTRASQNGGNRVASGGQADEQRWSRRDF